jgi:hypothetical protein
MQSLKNRSKRAVRAYSKDNDAIVAKKGSYTIVSSLNQTPQRA